MASISDEKKVYMSPVQKKALLSYVQQQPLLVGGKFTKEFTHKNAEDRWKQIAQKLNQIPGSVKTWKEWRRSYHDCKSNTFKKKVIVNKTENRIAGQVFMGDKKNIIKLANKVVYDVSGSSSTDQPEETEDQRNIIPSKIEKSSFLKQFFKPLSQKEDEVSDETPEANHELEQYTNPVISSVISLSEPKAKLSKPNPEDKRQKTLDEISGTLKSILEVEKRKADSLDKISSVLSAYFNLKTKGYCDEEEFSP